MEVVLIAGAAYAATYALLRNKEPAANPISLDKRPFEEGVVMTTYVRTRIHESIGTGAEIGAAVGVLPNTDSLKYSVPGGRLPKMPTLSLADVPLNSKPPPEQPSLPDISMPAPSEFAPLVDSSGADPNSLHPGTITVVPARLRPPHDSPPKERMSSKGPNECMQVLERDPNAPMQTDPIASGSWEHEIDWLQLAIDHRAMLETVKSVSDEPGDAVKAKAVVDRVKATVIPQSKPYTEELVNKAIASLPKEFFANTKKATGREQLASEEMLLKYRKTRARSTRIIKSMAAAKLRLSPNANQLTEVVALMMQGKRTGAFKDDGELYMYSESDDQYAAANLRYWQSRAK